MNLRASLASRVVCEEKCQIVLFHQIQSAGGCKSPSDYATLLNAFVDRLGEVMTESNILPYDSQAILIDDHGAGFDWPAITRTLIDTIPWQVEIARIFGREMPIPRMTAWFVTVLIPTAASFIYQPHSPQSSSACVNVPKRYRVPHSMPLWPISIGLVATVWGCTVITRPGLGTAQP